MILADKILNLRKKNGWSQDELAEKLKVSRQSVSKWEGAQSIPDINKIIEMASLFEVSTDYLLKDDKETPDFTPGTDDEMNDTIKVSLEEANKMMEQNEKYSRRTALGVGLCILSPTIMILLLGLNEVFKSIGKPFSEGVAIGVGLPCLFVFIACAVALFIFNNEHSKKLEKLSQNNLSLEYGVAGVVKEKRDAFKNTYTSGLVIGVALCIMCAVPYIIAGALDVAEFLYIFLVVIMFILIAAGVTLIVYVSCKKNLYNIYLQEDDYEPKNRASNKLMGRISSLYWPLMAAIYLTWSFLTNNWDISWIVWPVAGVVYAAICGFVKNSK